MKNPLHRRAGLLVRAVGLLVGALVVGSVPMARAAEETASPTAYPGGAWEPATPSYGTSTDEGIEVRMDDGARLIVDITYPTDPVTNARAAGPFPVLLNQDMYAGAPSGMLAEEAVGFGEYFVQRGYIFVHAHDRGTGGSEGHFDPGFGDRVGLDGVELAYWAADPANVPGANGQVGLQGCSALGVVQLSTLAALGSLLEDDGVVYVPGPTPAAPGRTVPVTDDTNPVDASFPACVGSSVFHEQYTDNGVPSTINVLSLAQPAAQGVLIGYNLQDPSSNYEQSSSSLDMMTGGDPGFHREHWQERNFIRRAPQIARTGVPVITWVGWGEGGPIGIHPLYAALQNASAGREPHAPMLPACPPKGRQSGKQLGECQTISTKYHALAGDWGHGGGLDEGIELQWFETWIRGEDTGLESADEPIHLEELPDASSDRWINLTRYPMSDAYAAHYLDVGGVLSTEAPTSDGSETLVWPVGPPVSYTVAQPVDVDRTIVGPAAVRLFVESSNTNAHLFVELVDVAEDGTATPITHGSILASRRATAPYFSEGDAHLDPLDPWSWTADNGLPAVPYLTLLEDDYVAPGDVVKLDVPLQTTAWRLLAGHSLRLTVATNAGEHCLPTGLFAPPAGCAFSIPTAQSLVGGVYTLHHGPERVSFVNVPLVRSDAITTAASGATPTSGGVVLPLDWGSSGERPKG